MKPRLVDIPVTPKTRAALIKLKGKRTYDQLLREELLREELL